MADTEFSQLASGNPAQSTDIIPVSRPPFGPGSNYKVTAGSIAALVVLPTFGTLAAGTSTAAFAMGSGGSLTVSGTGIVQATQVQNVVISGAAPSAGQALIATSPIAADWQTIAVVTGITVSGTPTVGQVLTATSSTAASWQTLASISAPTVQFAVPDWYNMVGTS